MPGLIVGEGRRSPRDNCRILRPYILWKRRKEQLAEGALLMRIKREEEKRKKEEEEKRCSKREGRLSRIHEIEKELLKVRQKKYNLEENLKSLQEQKHQLFLCLKSSLLAKEYVRKERVPTLGEFHFQSESGSEFPQMNWEMQLQSQSNCISTQMQVNAPLYQDERDV